MKCTLRRVILLLLFTFSASSWSAEMYLHTFYDGAPLKGLSISLDDEIVGKTDRFGGVSASISVGLHELVVRRKNTVISTIEFDSFADQDVEIKISYTDARPEGAVVVQHFSVDSEDDAYGFLTGTVKDVNGNPIAFARVSSDDDYYEAVTSENGTYVLRVSRGLHQIQVVHPEYENAYINDIRMMADIGISVAVTMRSASAPIEAPVLEEVVVLGVFNPQDNGVDVERFATTVSDVLDVNQLARMGDSNVAAALGRIVGVSVTDDKYANVRGLDGRYISSTLNGLLMPSTDPLRRDVQLDLFPSNILGGIEIQKSYSPDVLGTTTGGSVKIKTLGLPDERVAKFSMSGGYNAEFTGDDVSSYRGSETDGWGFDSGLRDLSSQVLRATGNGMGLNVCDPAIDPVRCTSPRDASLLGVKFQDDYNLKSKKANPDFSATAAYGDRIEMDAGGFGYYAAVSYKHSTGDRGTAGLNDVLDEVGSYHRTKENTAVNVYFVTGFEFNNGNEILSKTIALRSTDDITRRDEVIDQDDVRIQETILEFVERQFISQQFSGVNYLEVGEQEHILDWRLGYSETERYEPDRRQYQYRNDVFIPSSLERRWSDLQEESIDLGLDYTIPLSVNADISGELTLGMLWSDRDRDVELYRFSLRGGARADEVDRGIDQNLEQVLSYENFLRDRFRLNTTTTATDSYSSTEETQAAYLMTTLEIGESITLAGGVRYEDFSQALEYPNSPSSNSALDSDDILPALSVIYRFNDALQFRVGASQTVSYPGLIERSESLVYDPATDDPIFGNPNLEISTIDNLDFRAEYYFSADESISLAFFYKDIDAPIERQVPDASGSAAAGITFRNAEAATLEGIEIDAYKYLIEGDESQLFVAGNVSYIQSEVDLDEESIRLEGAGSDGRELQGQSPWLANIQLGYDHFPTEQKVTLLINYFDDRIYRITRGGNNAPEIESGRAIVNLNYEKLFGEGFTFKAQIKNLFNEKVEYESNNRVIEIYEEGMSISFSVEYQFL